MFRAPRVSCSCLFALKTRSSNPPAVFNCLPPSRTGLITPQPPSSGSLTGSLPSELGGLSKFTLSFEVQDNLFTSTIPTGELRYKDHTLFELEPAHTTHTSVLYHPHRIHTPAELGQLSYITGSFNLGTNLFSLAIPTELGMLSEMVHDFRLTSWSDSSSNLPSELGNLVKMTYGFAMSGCSLVGTIPTEIGRMSEMAMNLYFHSNSLNSTIPTELGQLDQMSSHFSLYSNLLSSAIPTQLGQLDQMTNDFKLYSNSLSSAIPTGES